MEENRIDPYQIVGFLLLIACAVWVFYFTPEPALNIDEAESAIEFSDDQVSKPEENIQSNDLEFSITEIQQELITLENNDLKLVVSNKGGEIVESVLKNYFDKEGNKIKINDSNQIFNLVSSNKSLRAFDSSKIIFESQLTENSEGYNLNLVHKENGSELLSLTYFLPKDGFMVDITVNVNNRDLSNLNLKWDLLSIHNSRSASYENRYTYINYKNEDDNVRDLSAYSDDDESGNANWISYSQHLFNSILIFNELKKDISFSSFNLESTSNSNSELYEIDGEIKYLKKFETTIPLENFSDSFKLYMGPNDYYILNDTYEGISDSIWFGWGIFGWINRNIFFPLYYFLSSFLSAGFAIIVMVIITRLAMSPVQYKMYVGQAKMKILRPEITAATEKYKDDPMKRNQETMKIYNQAGANPLSGCVPALLQLPVFYALFCFFPVAFALREESFLWADDLSSYDVIAELPFYIPFYGDHISLFPITAAIAMFFYTRMSGSQQMQPQQPGMPNMKFIMYVIPFTLLIFFNNFASGLSLYYTVSNILTILIMLTIKNLILDEKKILATIEEKKKQPTTENRFQRRMRKMQEMMEEAEKKQKLKRKR